MQNFHNFPRTTVHRSHGVSSMKIGRIQNFRWNSPATGYMVHGYIVQLYEISQNSHKNSMLVNHKSLFSMTNGDFE